MNNSETVDLLFIFSITIIVVWFYCQWEVTTLTIVSFPSHWLMTFILDISPLLTRRNWRQRCINKTHTRLTLELFILIGNLDISEVWNTMCFYWCKTYICVLCWFLCNMCLYNNKLECKLEWPGNTVNKCVSQQHVSMSTIFFCKVTLCRQISYIFRQSRG